MIMQMRSIAIVDDHQLIIDGIQKMLSENDNWQFAGGFTNSLSFEACFTHQNMPDVLLLDINLLKEDGIEICKRFTKKYPTLKTIMLTNTEEAAVAKHAIKNGAKGFLLKNITAQELFDCLEKVMAGEIGLHIKIEKLVIQANLFGKKENNNYVPKLSSREKEILNLIANEMTTQEIADKLFISVNTVETHRASLLSKLGSRNIAGLIKTAMEKGLID
jgi:DNA-binding NarL/FixJ family response regulator